MPDFNLGAGELNQRLHFQSRPMVGDGFGNMVPGGEFETAFTVWAKLQPLRGSETVMAARLAGRQPFVITVRRSSQAREVNEAWQAVDANDAGRIFAITSPPADPDGRRVWLQMIAVEGGVS